MPCRGGGDEVGANEAEGLGSGSGPHAPGLIIVEGNPQVAMQADVQVVII
jgi:hypothetical protein